MKIGHIISATPTELLATIDPDQAVGLYEFVAIDGVEPTPEGPKPVRVLGQIVRIYRDPYQLKRDLPLYSVMEAVAHELLEVQVAKVKVLGYLSADGEVHVPKMPPRVGSSVYLAEDREVEEFYGRGELCIGKLMPRGIDACLSLEGIKRHVAVIAATGSGKTWFSVVLIEELLKQGGRVLVLDPHGEYVAAAESARAQGYNAVVVKVARHHVGDVMYKIGVVDTDPDALADAAGVPPNASKIRYAVYLAHAIARRAHEAGRRVDLRDLVALLRSAAARSAADKLVKEWGVDGGEELEDLKELAQRNRHSVFSAAAYLKRLASLGVFSTRTTALSKILADLTIVNLAGASDEVVDYVAWHLLMRVFKARVRHVRGLPGPKLDEPIAVFLEEAHRFAPPKAVRRTRSYEAVARIASEGRKFGVYLVVITQRPSRVDPDVMSQMQSQVVMRVVNPKDQEAVRDSSEQLAQDFLDNLPGLDRGEAIVAGPLVRLPAVIKLRDRQFEYGGADISLAEAWHRRRKEAEADKGVILAWRRLFGRVPPPDVALASRRLEVKSKVSENGAWRIVVAGGDGEAVVELSLERNYARCSRCNSAQCPHVYRALAEVVRVAAQR